MDKRILILAGPNGAGKTTFAREYLLQEASCPAFETVYKPLVDVWMLYDNAGDAPILIASGGKP